MNKKRGFTLVELLVVIAVIALLMAILMPVLRRANDQAMRILCGNHIKNLMLSMTMYADTHNNKIVQIDPIGIKNWPWNATVAETTELLRNMGTDVSALTLPVSVQFSTNFYCPANTQQKRFRDGYWNYAITPTPTSANYRVLGYAFLWKALYNRNGAMPILGLGGNPDPAKNNCSGTTCAGKWVDRTDIPQASEVELIVDVTMSLQVPGDLLNYPNGKFAGIATITTPGGTANQSNHLVTDAKAAGGNIGFADNHVEWRPSTEMMHRCTVTTTLVSGGTGTIWWWW